MDNNREVETLAYFLWQNAGEPSGTAERDWLFAEHAVQSGSVSPPDWSRGDATDAAGMEGAAGGRERVGG
jgi:hypothetical protein